MAELARERRSTFNYMRYISKNWLAEQKNTLRGIGILVFTSYAWILFSFNNW